MFTVLYKLYLFIISYCTGQYKLHPFVISLFTWLYTCYPVFFIIIYWMVHIVLVYHNSHYVLDCTNCTCLSYHFLLDCTHAYLFIIIYWTFQIVPVYHIIISWVIHFTISVYHIYWYVSIVPVFHIHWSVQRKFPYIIFIIQICLVLNTTSLFYVIQRRSFRQSFIIILISVTLSYGYISIPVTQSVSVTVGHQPPVTISINNFIGLDVINLHSVYSGMVWVTFIITSFNFNFSSIFGYESRE